MARTPVRRIVVDPPVTADSPEQEETSLPGSPPDPRRLHQATDRLNEVLTRFEESLAGLKLGVSASVVLDEDENGNWIQYLAFRKEKGSFKLVVDGGQEGIPESFSTTPITSASRETRLRAVDKLKELYKELVKAFEQEVKLVDVSIARVEELERALRAKAAK